MSVGIGKGDGAIFATVGKEFFPIGPTGRGHLRIPMKGTTLSDTGGPTMTIGPRTTTTEVLDIV